MNPAPILVTIVSSAMLLMTVQPARAQQVKINTWSGENFSNYVEGNGFSSTTFTGGQSLEPKTLGEVITSKVIVV